MIPVNLPLVNGREKELLIECIESGWISEGPYVKKFEENFSNFIGMNHGIAVTNGTAALEAAIFAIDLKEGDEVIMPSFTIISCAIAALRFGARGGEGRGIRSVGASLCPVAPQGRWRGDRGRGTAADTTAVW